MSEIQSLSLDDFRAGTLGYLDRLGRAHRLPTPRDMRHPIHVCALDTTRTGMVGRFELVDVAQDVADTEDLRVTVAIEPLKRVAFRGGSRSDDD